MKKFLSVLMLMILLLSCIGCGALPWEKDKESAPLPSHTHDFTLGVGETVDGLFTCRGASEGAVVLSSNGEVAEITDYKVEEIGKISYKITARKAGEVTILVKSGVNGITLDSHTYTVN